MKLNKKGREELRILTEKELSKVPVGTRIKLDKDLLDQLIFDTIIYKRNPRRIVKLPVWTGTFLQKLDLSEVSFEDVSWTLLGEVRESILGSELFDEDCWGEFLSKYGDSKKRITFSRTNIKVDFNKSWEMKAQRKSNRGVEITHCDFSFTDLSAVDTSNFEEIRGCDFSHTGLVLSRELTKKDYSIFYYSNLSNNNLGQSLGNFVIKLKDLITTGGPIFGQGCNLENTQLSILLEKDSLDKTAQSNFRTVLLGGDLNGCYINGKRILSSEERQCQARMKLDEYEAYKEEILSSISASIQKQIGTIHK